MVYINTTGKHNEVWLDKPYATITVECPDCPSTEDAYNSGWTDGSEDGYHKGYQSGYTDGLEACSGSSCNLQAPKTIKFQDLEWNYNPGPDRPDFNLAAGQYGLKNSPLHISADSGYDGLEEVILKGMIRPVGPYTIGYERGYNSGFTAGLEACSGGSCEGIWEDGYNSGFTDGVNSVECSGYSQEDLDAAFASGYSAGLRDCSGYTPATSITLNVDSAITGTGQASVTVNPSDAGTDITYTSSDPSVATINNNGGITVHQDGTVTFCAVDNLTQLQDCKTVSVSLPIPANTSMLDLIYETTEPNQTIRLFHGEAANNNGFFYTFYSGITKMVIDGVEVAKNEENIYKSYPRSADWYFYTFPTTGRHNVKFYVDRSFSAHTDTGWMLPAYELRDQLFGAYSLTLPEFPLVEAHIGEGYEIIEGGVFQGNTNVTAVTLPETLLTLGAYAFGISGIISIVIPDACTSLYGSTSQPIYFNGEVFEKAPNLSSVTIGSGITSIPSNTFYGCSALTTVVMRNPVPPSVIRTETYVVPGTRLEYVELFETCPLEHIYVPAEAVENYKTATFWSDHASIISAIQ